MNRYWKQFYGNGISNILDDLGSQGEWPSHPKLLDWLASQLVAHDYDAQHIIRLIVTSKTYRQISHASPEMVARDPENRLLGRGPRFRLHGEQIRDQALLVSGLLREKIGGPSVKPFQPDGLWRSVSYDGEESYVPDTGNGRQRRSLYSYWKRQLAPPSLAAFDAPTRETCVVERSRTNTPLQALVLMNDPNFIEAARALAKREMAEDGIGGLRAMFRRVLAREPDQFEH